MKLKIKDGLYIREIKDEKAIYDKQTGAVHFLNQTAAFIAELCDANHTEDELVNKLVDKFEVSQDIARKDVGNVLKNLEKNKILEKIS